MGIYYSITVGFGFEVPWEKIAAHPDYDEDLYYGEEFLDEILRKYKTLTYTTAHGYDAPITETSFVIAVARLTKSYDMHEATDLVILDSESPVLTPEESAEIDQIQLELQHVATVVQFVASSVG